MADIRLHAAANAHVTVLPRAARTAAPAAVPFVNPYCRGMILTIDATAKTDTPSLTVTIRRKDPTSGKMSTVLASAAITDVGTTVLRVYPGLTAAANSVANDVVPLEGDVLLAHGDADSITYSVGADFLR